MIEVRIHGRHGQGVLTTAELLAIAGSLEGRHSQALPYLGTEWTEDEVVAFCRIGDGELRDHETVTQPDALVVQDEDMLERALGVEGLRPGGYLLINSGRSFDNLGLPAFPLRAGHAITVPATEITRKVASRPIPTRRRPVGSPRCAAWCRGSRSSPRSGNGSPDSPAEHMPRPR